MQRNEKILIHKPYRKLLRTQNSLEKMMDRNPNSHVKKVKKLMHRQLKESFRNSTKLTSYESTHIAAAEELRDNKRKANLKSKSHLNIFKNAHWATSSESFIKPRKNRKTMESEFLQKKFIEQSFSEKRLAEHQNFLKGLLVASKNKIKIVDQKQCESTIEKDEFSQFRKLSQNRQVGCSEPVEKDEKSKKKLYNRHLRVYSQSSHVRFQTQQSVPTVPMGNESGQQSPNNVVFNPIRLQSEVRQTHIFNSQFESEGQLISPQRRELNEDSKTIERKPIITSQLNGASKVAGGMKSSPDKQHINQEGLRKSRRKKSQKKYYIETDCINDAEIQQVQFQTIQSVGRNKDNRSKASLLDRQILKNPYLPWESSKKNYVQAAENNAQDKSVLQTQKNQTSPKKKSIKIKSTPKIAENNKSSNKINDLTEEKSSEHFQTQSLNIKKNETKENPQNNPQNKKDKSSILDEFPKNLPEKSNLAASKPNLLKIKQKMQKINQLKQQLQMFTQMATYFSKKSKIFKQNAQSEQLLREKGGLKWHKLIFLCFKFAYFNFSLFEAYFRWGSPFVKVNQNHLQQFSSQNRLWAETLLKIQKSVRKNIQIERKDEWISMTFPDIKNALIDQLMEEIIILKNGTSQCFKYVANLARQIFDQSAILIKSVFISKFLKQENVISKSFRQGILRVINSCIILEGYVRNRPQLVLQPMNKVQELENLSLEMFRKSYNKLIHQIFCQ